MAQGGKDPSTGDAEQTEKARVPRSKEDFQALESESGAAEYEKANKPYRPLAEGERMPTMSELWTYASRRYGRFQGYAFASAIAVGGITFAAGSMSRSRGSSEKERASSAH